jgi:tetratricopeptide (TPR) repeat protein
MFMGNKNSTLKFQRAPNQEDNREDANREDNNTEENVENNMEDNNQASGFVYCDLTHYKEAIIALDKAIELNPKDGKAYNGRGFCYYYLNQDKKTVEDFKKALDDFARASELDPNYADIYNNIASIYNNIGDNEKAIINYTRGHCLPSGVICLYL